MIKDIKFNGYTAQPSDYSCPDGDLSLSLGAIPDNGTVQPFFPPKVVLTLKDGEDIIFIHKTTGYTHYIVYTAASGLLKALDASDNKTTYSIGTLAGVTSVNSVGNTLVAISPTGMNYWLWKKDHYLSLGNHMPELPMLFGLQYDWEQSDEFKVEYGGHSLMYDSSKYGSAFCNKYDVNSTVGGTPNDDYITQSVLAQANKFIADKATNKGRFIYPFLVRYAYRLFDGNYTMVSAPILMPCVTGCSPLPLVTRRHYEGNGDAHGYFDCWWLRMTAPVFDLMFRVSEVAALTTLKNWSDIVKSVDIFISKPVYTYDQNGKIESNVPISTIDFSIYGSNTGDTNGYSTQEAITRIRKYINDNDYAHDDVCAGYLSPLPARTADAVQGDIENTGNFFLLKSYNLEELKTTMSKVDVKSDYLQSLVNRAQLPSDDYDSHDTIIPKFSFAYNQRLNLSGIAKSLFQGYKPECLVTYMEVGPEVKNIWVYIRQDGEEIIVNCKSLNTVHGPIQYFFYPNANAYKAVVQYSTGYSTYTLSNHPVLNGAYYFKGFSYPAPATMTAPVVSANPYVPQLSKVYTSAVNNPFFFPLAGINTVGTGTIMGVSAAARALSQGQFGQFPLYCFSSDGIWALEVDNEGFYKARQPISRDVCTNPDSITQMDSSVVFVTDRGIMHISGAATECLSDILDTEEPFDISSLPHAADLISVFNGWLPGEEQQTTDQLPLDFTVKPFRTFLSGCRIVYDYTHQHIIVFNPAYNYAYAYSMRSQAWGMMLVLHNMKHAVNSYPDAMAMDVDNRLVNFSQYGRNYEAFLLVTRPLKLEAPDIQKTIDTIIQRGVFPKGNVAQVLYGSRDMFHWHLVWSSADHYLRGFAGTAYKYYRIAVVGRLSDGESLYGSTIQFNPRLTDQPR